MKPPAHKTGMHVHTATISFPFPEAPAPGKLVAVAPGVHWLRMPLPFVLDHINLWLLEDGDGWTAVDCGYGRSEVMLLWERIFEQLRGRPVTRAIVTHYHPDHAGLADWLCRRFELTPWMTQSEFLTAHTVYGEAAGYGVQPLLRLFRRHGLDQDRLDALARLGNTYHSGVPSLPPTFQRLLDGDEILIHGRSFRVIVGYGHAPEHATLYCAELKVLISGDMVLPKITTNVSVWPNDPDGDPLGRFIASLERYAELPADTLVLPSHGHVFHGLRTRVDALRRHHAQRLDALIDACAAPRAAAELLATLFRRELDVYQLLFAMGEAIAHLNHLWRRGKLERALDPAGVYRFTRRGGG